MTAGGSESGLTLIEVLVALGIIAMAIGLGLPLLQRGASPLQAMGAAREIAAALRESRAAAIAHNRAIAFWLDTTTGSFGYDERRFALPARNGTASLELTLYTTEDQRDKTAGGTKGQAGSIRFFPGGGSTGGGVAVADGRRQILITVDWLSGQVRMSESAASTTAGARGAVHAAR